MVAAGLSDPKVVVMSNTARGTTETRCQVLCASFVKLGVYFLLKLQKKKSIKTNYQTWGVEKAQSKRSSCRLGTEHAQ